MRGNRIIRLDYSTWRPRAHKDDMLTHCTSYVGAVSQKVNENTCSLPDSLVSRAQRSCKSESCLISQSLSRSVLSIEHTGTEKTWDEKDRNIKFQYFPEMIDGIQNLFTYK